jgi:hypothetical protein
MKYIENFFESFKKLDKLFEDRYSEIEKIEDYFLELSDYSEHILPITVDVNTHYVRSNHRKVKGFKISIKYDITDQVFC